MLFTRQADYASKTIYYLARQNSHKHISTKSIASAQKIPLSFLSKIIARLSIAGLLNVRRGAYGGVALARQPSDISLLDVVEAIDGPIVMNECVVDPNDCESNEDCPLRPIWCNLQKALVNQMRSATFDQLGSHNFDV